jgi:tetratricopeptide (TPR) repeat protein
MAEFDRSLEMWDALAKIDPTNNLPRLRRAMCFFFKGDTDRAASEIAKAEKFARGVDQLTLVAFVYAWLKDFDAANRALGKLEKSEPDAPQAAEVSAWILTQQGKVAEARAKMKIVIDRNGTLFGIEDEIATFYAIQGDKDQAIDWLTRAVAAGAPNLAWYRSNFFASCKGDPRYEAIVKLLSDEYDALKKDIPSLH